MNSESDMFSVDDSSLLKDSESSEQSDEGSLSGPSEDEQRPQDTLGVRTAATSAWARRRTAATQRTAHRPTSTRPDLSYALSGWSPKPGQRKRRRVEEIEPVNSVRDKELPHADGAAPALPRGQASDRLSWTNFFGNASPAFRTHEQGLSFTGNPREHDASEFIDLYRRHKHTSPPPKKRHNSSHHSQQSSPNTCGLWLAFIGLMFTFAILLMIGVIQIEPHVLW